MRSTRGWAVAGLVAAMTAGAAAPAQASAGPCLQQVQGELAATSVSYEFRDIAEAVLRVTVPVEKVRHHVPSHYKLLGEATGTATLVAAHGSVDALSVGCSDGAPATVAEYGVMIESPDGTVGRHAYYLSMLTDNEELVDRLGTLGVPVKFADGQFGVEPVPSSGDVRITAQETWTGGAVELSATATEPGTKRGKDAPGVRFWFDGPRGTVRTEYNCPRCLPRTPTTEGSVFATGSAMEAILAGNRVVGGFFIRATLTATAELVG